MLASQGDPPLLARRGARRAGWWVRHKQEILQRNLTHHPVRAAKEASQLFLTGADPPLLARRGKYSRRASTVPDHSTPFVDGISFTSPVTRVAVCNARAIALKIVSAMWCWFRPY